MRKLLYLFAIVLIGAACQETESVKEDVFTGNESSYALLAGSTYPISGTVYFKERKDGGTLVRLELTGTDGDVQHPVHLHLGNISTPNAAISALLNPVLGSSGVSETTLTMLSDESSIDYSALMQMTACIKVHLSDSGPEKDIVLAAGNIGAAASDGPSGGRLGISTCKSE